MNSVDYDFCIVGSGPTAASIITNLPISSKILIIDRGKLPKKQTIILKEEMNLSDPNDWDLSNFVPKLSPSTKKYYAKPYFSDRYSFNYDKRTETFSPDSVGLGGFSKVWGATAFPYLKADLYYMCKSANIVFSNEFNLIDQLLTPISNLGFKSYIKELYTHFPSNVLEVDRGTVCFEARKLFKFPNTLVLPAVVAVDYGNVKNKTKGCVKCGICQIGCPYDFIWTSEGYIKSKLEIVKYIKGEVIKCTQNADGTESITYQQETSVLKVTCKKVFLAGGAISNARILLRSFTKFNSISIKDNQTNIIAGFSIRKSLPILKDSLAEFFVFDKSRKNQVLSQGQFYTNSKYLQVRLLSEYPILAKIPKFLTEYFFNHFFCGLVFNSQNASGEIIVGNDYNLNIKTSFTISNLIRSKYRSFRFNFVLLFQGLFVIPFVTRRLGVGGGNHFGSIQADCWTDTDVKEFFTTGKVDRGREIYAFGTASLPVLVPGPVTYMSMVNTVRQLNLVVSTGFTC